jgi:hypothetical protein
MKSVPYLNLSAESVHPALILACAVENATLDIVLDPKTI